MSLVVNVSLCLSISGNLFRIVKSGPLYSVGTDRIAARELYCDPSPTDQRWFDGIRFSPTGTSHTKPIVAVIPTLWILAMQ
ncbi:unnamed protein product [Fusarium graminearum]|uniref:Uncharacterized protein n=1 Tax=Gibberella zeae TaxID=5518 RepID=A0A4U9F8S7_GIBZA|nr:unnamed protein product [Fusarium graminearum]CAF3458953.1 unnamed protein product [Fusarium graminearum]CAF3620337.1 unnamed protein product [Fusarium graminearum]CAG1961729.1 unnamed protein product [Fusarium graminearum]CAG1983234.1 unnamed protein product [Fusarium graminearum]